MGASGPQQSRYDAVVIGSGPNGLAAAATLVREGLSVLVVEGHAEPGGGARTAELTLPGFRHDVCSAVHPMAMASPLLNALHLEKFGLEWCHPETLLAHPLDGGRAGFMKQSLAATCEGLEADDGKRWAALFEHLAAHAPRLWPMLLGPVTRLPRHPVLMTRFGLKAMRSAVGLVRGFKSEEARALIAGNAAHSVVPLHFPFSGAVAMALGVAGHSTGWPVAKGGSSAIVHALCRYIEAMGGEIVCGWRIRSLDELPPSDAVLCDTGPHQLAAIAGQALPASYQNRLRRYQYGPAVYKLDLALSEAIPWENAHCRTAGTVHVGGTFAEVAASEQAAWDGRECATPMVLVGQQSLCDASRAPAGKHTVWAYCHVPKGWPGDASEAILGQIERFAPGFRDTILATHQMGPADYERYNPNNVQGDIVGGAMMPTQLFTRPLWQWNPYTTPSPRVFLCSSSTPPGGGVHGMCGWHAARTVLQKVFGRSPSSLSEASPAPV